MQPSPATTRTRTTRSNRNNARFLGDVSSKRTHWPTVEAPRALSNGMVKFYANTRRVADAIRGLVQLLHVHGLHVATAITPIF